MSDNGHAFLLVFKVIGHSASFKRARREVLILVVLHQPRTYAWIFMTCGFNIKSSRTGYSFYLQTSDNMCTGSYNDLVNIV